VLPHADPSVCSLPIDALSRHFPRALLQATVAPSIFFTPPFLFAGGLPTADWVPNCPSNPITQRVRRKRQRLPPSLLIGNASGVFLAFRRTAWPRRFRSRLATIRPESGARAPPPFMVGGSGARTFGCWPKGLQCSSKTGSQMSAFEVSDLRGLLFRFIEVPFLSARHPRSVRRSCDPPDCRAAGTLAW
jgi:hypothetical protein